MINKITFTGRETMLTNGIKNCHEIGSKTMHDYVSASKVFENAQAVKTNNATDYFRPDALMEMPKQKNTQKVQLVNVELEKDYASAHGTPEKNINIVV